MQLTIFTPRKVEPHDNGPLFVEVHALLAVGRQKPMSAWQPRYTIHDCLLLGFHERTSRHPEKPEGWVGIPSYHAHGSFVFNKVKLRFLVLDRFVDQHYCPSKLLLEQVSLPSRFGSDLDKVFKGGEKPFPLATVLNIGIQVLFYSWDSLLRSASAPEIW